MGRYAEDITALACSADTAQSSPKIWQQQAGSRAMLGGIARHCWHLSALELACARALSSPYPNCVSMLHVSDTETRKGAHTWLYDKDGQVWQICKCSDMDCFAVPAVSGLQ